MMSIPSKARKTRTNSAELLRTRGSSDPHPFQHVCRCTAMDHNSGCVICGSPLVYHGEVRMMTCAVCGAECMGTAECVNGHYVCDRCHGSGVTTMKAACLASSSRDPVDIAIRLMELPGIHMHGPENHVLVGSALLTAYFNAGGDLDLPSALDEMSRRGSQIPGGVCGMWGCCGAAISCGIAYSIITRTTPLSVESWGMSNLITSRCLERIASIGGPRCCKRDAFASLTVACGFVEEALGVSLEVPESIVCRFSPGNQQCIGVRCPYSGRGD